MPGSDGRFAIQWLRELQYARTQEQRTLYETRMQGFEDYYRWLHSLGRVRNNDTMRNH
jgi:hypothetical protein